ncbi:MAG TPA: trigger factor [Longimicrobiales bacterium]|nr:trigger factor [Longimicrobiales bacterium]
MAMNDTQSDLTITIDSPKTWARRLKIRVPADRVARQRAEITRKLAGRIRMPGFRQGKVPSQVVERTYGPAIEQETLERAVGDAYREALETQGLQPITQGAVENVDYQPGSDLTFDVVFEVRPEIELNRLGGFQVRAEKAAVAEEEVDRVLDRLREEHAIWEPAGEEHPSNGDMASVEITALGEGGEPEEGAKPRPYQIILGKGEARPEVEEAIRSLKPGEETDFSLEIQHEAGEHGAAEAHTHEHRARVKLLAVKHPRLPELNDEFASQLGDFESMAVLRDRIRSDLEREAETEAEAGLRRQLIDQVIDANPFEVPDAMVDNYLDRLFRIKDEKEREQLREVRENARPGAERAIRRMLVIERVAELEGLSATPAELDARVDEMAARTGRSPQEVRKQLQKSEQLHALEDEITEEKVFGYLKSLSEVA